MFVYSIKTGDRQVDLRLIIFTAIYSEFWDQENGINFFYEVDES